MPLSDLPLPAVLLGIGATAVMDLWLLALARLGVPSSSFALIGRWVGHMGRGRFVHPGIATAAPLRAELALGWATHYAIGIAYAALMLGLAGSDWLQQPTPAPALAFGLATLAAPWLVMQPAMGAGIAAAKTPAPWANRLRSAANHAVFGLGLYLAAAALAALRG